MEIALVRHYKVDIAWENYMSSEDFLQWVEDYDNSRVILGKVDINEEDYDGCFCSPLRRARETAQHIFKGEIVEFEELKEIGIAPILSTKHKLNYSFWAWTARLSWFINHKSQPETRKETYKRVENLINKIENSGHKKVLVVCHGLIMSVIAKELIKKGYSGEKLTRIKNGDVYHYRK